MILKKKQIIYFSKRILRLREKVYSNFLRIGNIEYSKLRNLELGNNNEAKELRT